MQYTVGIDFGTLSARAMAMELATGQEVASAEFVYPHGVMDRQLPTGEKLPPQYALQHPQDYLDALSALIRELKIDPALIRGIGIDFTTCTMLPVYADGTPLCFDPQFTRQPHAYVKLWKHHGAVEQARQLDAVAHSRGEKWLSNCGGTSSSEFLFPKILETLQEAPQVYEKTFRFCEAVDWLCWMLTGQEVHNPCTAALKGYWDGKYPDNDFFRQVDPRLEGIIGTKVSQQVGRVDQLAGYISAAGASLTGLPKGIPVAMPVGDAHAPLPALNVTKPGQALLVVGTSGVLLSNTDKRVCVPGICALTDGGIYPGLCTMEAGQAGLGDCFDWFVKNCVSAEYQQQAKERGISLHTLLQEKAALQRPGEHRLIALDWFSGNRSILKNDGLTGLVLGMDLQTRPEDIYRALMEATGFGLRVILDNYEAHGVAIDSICAAGGIALKSPFLMQLYADILNRTIAVSSATQSGARGSAIYAAVAAGVCPDIFRAAERYAQPVTLHYTPNSKNVAIYQELYGLYRQLHDHFGAGGSNAMEKLSQIYKLGQS